MRTKIWTFSIVLTLLLGISVIPQASAAQKITYTLISPFQNSYDEKGAFKPPVKFSQSDIKFALTDNCGFVLGKKPEVEVQSASGKIVASVKMTPAHKLSSSTWIKDENGENKFRIRGVCTFIGVITKKLPDSNFYQFSAYAEGRAGDWSYPYTSKQLAAMKNGIKETRFLDDLRTAGAITPVPDIEAPQIKPAICTEGNLSYFSSSDKNGEEGMVQVAYFMVTNGLYRPAKRTANTPQVEHIGERVQGNDDFFVEVDNRNLNGLLDPTFVTWRKDGENNFSTNLSIKYWTYTEGEVRKIAKEKTFSIQISGDCKTASVTSP